MNIGVFFPLYPCNFIPKSGLLGASCSAMGDNRPSWGWYTMTPVMVGYWDGGIGWIPHYIQKNSSISWVFITLFRYLVKTTSFITIFINFRCFHVFFFTDLFPTIFLMSNRSISWWSLASPGGWHELLDPGQSWAPPGHVQEAQWMAGWNLMWIFGRFWVLSKNIYSNI